MDYVDDENGKFCDLDSLNLDQDSLKLVHKATEQFSGTTIRYVRVERGLSGVIKIVAKPESLFPLLLKIGPKSEIEQELTGDQLLRYRLPPLSLPPLEGAHFENESGVIVYRYITGGRVRHLVKRLDTEFHKLSTYSVLRIIDQVYDVILKKSHWLDGKYEMRSLELPDLPTPKELIGSGKWTRMLDAYIDFKNKIDGIIAPHGIIHGDIHAKNILILGNTTPILIDFAMAKSDACHYMDFAKLETNLQFQINNSVAKKMWRVSDQVYSEDSLIIPRSNTKLLTCVHRIRSNLWQGCTRNSLRMNNTDIDFGYRGNLLYCLARFYSRVSNCKKNRNTAYREFFGLLGNHDIVQESL